MGATAESAESAKKNGGSVLFTALGLFEDTLDMEKALIALRRQKREPSEISVLLRDRDAESDTVTGGAVPRAVSEHTLDAVGGWLVGLAELVLQDGLNYLVAGPIGAAVAAAPDLNRADDDSEIRTGDGAGAEDSEGALAAALAQFGFSREESDYLAHRLNAGDAIVALTTKDPDLLRKTRRLFADCDAVHIGQAQTDARVFRDAQRILSRPTKASAKEVIVADAVDPFLDVCALKIPPRWARTVCGSRIVDSKGVEVGLVEAILAMPGEEIDDERLRQTARYVVISSHRVLGLGRRRVAVPSDLVDLDRSPPEVRVPASEVHRAPAYNPNAPFSRREEETIFAHFGAKPYWSGSSAEGSLA
jgi:hypothetical protein